MEHIPFHLLTDYACDRIAEQRVRQMVMAHVNHCAECRQALTIAWQITQRAQVVAPEQPSPSLVQRVLKATRAYCAGDVATSVPATLLHDSKLDAALQGIRGALQERELLFTFGSFDLHLSIVHTAATESYTLLGQLMAGETSTCDVEGSRIELRQDETTMRIVLADEIGRFRMSHLPQGDYSLLIATDSLATTVDTFSVAA